MNDELHEGREQSLTVKKVSSLFEDFLNVTRLSKTLIELEAG